MKLHARIGLTVTGLLTALTATISVLLSFSIGPLLNEEHHNSLLLLGRHIAEELADPAVRNDRHGMQRILSTFDLRGGSIEYLYVLDGSGAVAADTFPGDVPRGILAAGRSVASNEYRERTVLQGGRAITDVEFPVAAGGGSTLHMGVSDRHHAELVGKARARVMVVGAFFVSLGGGLSFLLGYWITRPLVGVASALEAIGGGDLSRRVPVGSRDEIGHLAAAFNDMVEKREQAENEAIRLGFELDERVEQRTAQLEAANRELEAFSYSVSHDLRAPLRSIDGFSKALLEDHFERLDPEGRDFLRRVRRASQRMGQLIDDILKFSRLTRGELFLEPVDLSALSREVSQVLQDADPGRTVKITVQDGIMCRGDRKMLRVVLENLFGNAWKFTSKVEQGRILFSAVPSKDGTAYFIRDNGAGFDMACAQKLFGAFQRMHSDAEFPGTGIGLATVQRIIHRHGGTIWAESEPGKGATFYFTLGRGAAA